MKTKSLLLVAMILIGSTMMAQESQEPEHHYVRPGGYENTMILRAKVCINGVEQQSENVIEIGAFNGDVVTDSQFVGPFTSHNYYRVNMNIGGNGSSSYPITFKLYNHENGQEIVDYTITDPEGNLMEGINWVNDDNTIFGTMANPYVLNFLTMTTYPKTIEAYGDSEKGGYYLIASPVTQEVTPTADNGFLAETAANYDLYYFDQVGDAEGKEWINFKDENMGGFNLTNGTGYLYASKEGTTLNFTGTPYSGDGVIQLTYDENAEEFAGYNLVGNPFLEAATPNREYYVMNPDTRDEIIQGDEAVPAMEGAFVVAEGEENETVTFEPGNKKKSRLAINLIIERGVIDRAVVNFGSNSTLPKFQLNPNHTKVYIPMEGKDYAVVSASEMGELPVSFKAESNGNYTLSLNAQEVSFAYLHLIDNMTGLDQDMLSNPNYTFDARTTDYANRFKLVFATGNATDEFAFFSNGSFVINNEGNAIVQVIDVNGRIISSESINGCANVNVKAAAGVYMIRLMNGNDVKTQKIIMK